MVILQTLWRCWEKYGGAGRIFRDNLGCMVQLWPQTLLYSFLLWSQRINVSQSKKRYLSPSPSLLLLSKLNFIHKQKWSNILYKPKSFQFQLFLIFLWYFSVLSTHSDVGCCTFNPNNSKPQCNNNNCNALSNSQIVVS